MANETKFTPPINMCWWKVTHTATRRVAYGYAKTAYFAVQEARFLNGHSCGWVLSECDVELLKDYRPGLV